MDMTGEEEGSAGAAGSTEAGWGVAIAVIGRGVFSSSAWRDPC